jgi:hypothetical protein
MVMSVVAAFMSAQPLPSRSRWIWLSGALNQFEVTKDYHTASSSLDKLCHCARPVPRRFPGHLLEEGQKGLEAREFLFIMQRPLEN